MTGIGEGMFLGEVAHTYKNNESCVRSFSLADIQSVIFFVPATLLKSFV